jgi:triosephosphate isomerase
VTRGNAALLRAEEQIDGLLVGGASLDAENWTSIVRA